MSAVRTANRIVLTLVAGFCSVSIVRADEVTFWNSLALDVMKESSTSPPKVAWDLAIVQSSV